MGDQQETRIRTAKALHQQSATNAAKQPLPTSVPVHPLLQLQRLIGNQAVNRLIQAKLTIGEPGDKYEQEADRVAADVVNRINAPTPQQSSQGQTVQRQEMPEDEKLQTKPEISTIQRQEMSQEEELQTKLEVGAIQRQEMPEDEKLQTKSMVQRQPGGDGMAATPQLEASIQQTRGGGQPLLKSIREPMEQAFGADFSGVRVHTDATSDELNQSLQAKAFTTGQDIFFRQGEYDPENKKELLAHELTHVVQQSGGAVQRSPLQPHQLQQHSPTQTHTASLIDQVISRTGDKTVLQRFWMREPADQEPHWVEPRYMLARALENSTYQVEVRYGKPNKRGIYKKRTETRDEMKKDYPLLGPSSQVYKKRADVRITWVNLRQMVDAIGIQKVEAILNGDPHWRMNGGTPLLLKHLNPFRQMGLNVVTTLMRQHHNLTASFLQDLSPQEMETYFSNTPVQQLGQVTGAEFASFVGMVHKEKEMPQTEMLPLSPTTGQGAHHVSEHGAQSTTQQTIERAVAYAYKRGNNNATKGNWVSHEVADAAMRWAQTRINLWVQQADADNTRTLGVLNSVPVPNGIFGTNAFRNNVRAVISQGEYEHGNVSGKRGAATAVVTGDFTDLGGTVQAGAITGNFTGGSVTRDIPGADLPPLTAIDSLTFRGNGAVNADINAITVAGGQLNGTIVGQTTFSNGHVDIQAGVTEFFDGTGNFQTPMDDNINAGNTNWNAIPSRIGGYVEARTGNQQVSVNPTSIGRLSSKLYRAGYWTNNIGMVFQKNEQGYSNGVTNLSNANPKVSNLQVTFANTAPGGRQAFRPRTLQDIVRNATITAKQEHYVKTSVGGAAPASINAPLLNDSVMVQGNIADLQAANLVPPILANLASVQLQVRNVQKVTTSPAPDIRTAGAAPALIRYQITLNGELLEFDLHSFSAPAAPAVNNFQVLMKLKNQDHATYLPFTAY